MLTACIRRRDLVALCLWHIVTPLSFHCYSFYSRYYNYCRYRLYYKYSFGFKNQFLGKNIFVQLFGVYAINGTGATFKVNKAVKVGCEHLHQREHVQTSNA